VKYRVLKIDWFFMKRFVKWAFSHYFIHINI
jgi:hypothetical protein